MDNPIAFMQALWFARHVHLAPEPPGNRSGTIMPQDMRKSEPMLVEFFGDSQIAGCGTENQSQGLAPAMARELARLSGRPVKWNATGQLGATMRRVRYRQLASFADTHTHADIIILCAGSNDILAGRDVTQWTDDLGGSITAAKRFSDLVIVTSAAQIWTCPALGRALKRKVKGLVHQQTWVSRQICEVHDALFVDLTTPNVHTDEKEFWASDRFHPSAIGYQHIATAFGQELSHLDMALFR